MVIKNCYLYLTDCLAEFCKELSDRNLIIKLPVANMAMTYFCISWSKCGGGQ